MNDIKLVGKYFYVRADEDIMIRSNSNKYIRLPKGFWRLDIENVRRYFSNDVVYVTSSGNIYDVFCSDVDIQEVQGNDSANFDSLILLQGAVLNALDLLIEKTQIIANTNNIAMQAYIEGLPESEPVNLGYIEGSLNTGVSSTAFVADVYIASTSKYTFNCKLVMSRQVSTTKKNIYASDYEAAYHDVYQLNVANSMLRYVSENMTFPNPGEFIFNLFDNGNNRLTGYIIDNVSFSYAISGRSGNQSIPSVEDSDNGNMHFCTQVGLILGTKSSNRVRGLFINRWENLGSKESRTLYSVSGTPSAVVGSESVTFSIPSSTIGLSNHSSFVSTYSVYYEDFSISFDVTKS